VPVCKSVENLAPPAGFDSSSNDKDGGGGGGDDYNYDYDYNNKPGNQEV
jgi:hypothetical protein